MNSTQLTQLRKDAVEDALLRVVMALEEAACDARAVEIVEQLRTQNGRPQATYRERLTIARNTTSIARLAHPHKEK